MVDDAFVNRAVDLADVYAQTAGGVGLGVGIDNEYRLLKRGQRCGQVDGGRGLAYTTFLISSSNDFCHWLSFFLRARERAGRTQVLIAKIHILWEIDDN
jgi:hypothetical protein